MTKIILTAGGPRARVEIAEAHLMLTRFQRILDSHDSPTVHTLNLSCRQWPAESLQVLLPLFQQIAPKVEYLKIDDTIAGLPTEQGLATLQFFADVFCRSPVTELNLDDNALGTRGIQVLQPLLHQPALRRLHLTNTGLSAEVMFTLAEVLEPIASRLTKLTLGRNQIGPDGAVTIARVLETCTALESFSYAGARPLTVGTRALCQGLAVMARTNSKLLYLNLNDCNLKAGEEDDDPIHALLEVLEASPRLSTLILRDGELEVSGMQRVFGALLQSGAKLHTLDLGCIGEIGPQGAAVAGAFLALQLETLQEFYFDTNELGDTGIADLVAPFTGGSCLRLLHLGCNEIEAAGARVLVDNRIPSLVELVLEDNMDLPAQAAAMLQTMYAKVVVDEGLEDEDDDDDGEQQDEAVGDIADQLAGGLNI
jgi:Ran GTPase-activating protein (RanGAP) involved in mRNA processing and transport